MATSTPILIQTVRSAQLSFATANTNRDGSGTLGTLFTAGANGSIVDHISIVALSTTTAGAIRVYINNGATSFLRWELLVPAIIPSVTVAVWSASIDCSQRSNWCGLPNLWSIRVSTNNAENFVAHAQGGDFGAL